MNQATYTFKVTPRLKDQVVSVCFYLFIGIAVLTRVLMFAHLNMNYIDTDQPLMWLGATDYSNGIFHEPRYYGQNYNTFFEGLLAVPLIWLKVPVYYAVPAVTQFLFLFPFLFTAIYLFMDKKKIHALLVLSVILCLPAGYDIMNSLSRGFVTGLFFNSFFILSICNPRNLKFLLLNTILAVAGYFANPNSLIVTAPFFTYFYLLNFQRKQYYFICLAAIIEYSLLYLLLDRFYSIHPEYKVFTLRVDFSLPFFLEKISTLDDVFAHITFFFERKSVFLFSVLIVILISIRKQKFALAAFGVFLLVVLVSLAARKNIDGYTWPFYSYSRMYLGIPLVVCLFLPLMNIKEKFLPIIILPIAFTFFKLANLKEDIKNTAEGQGVFISVIKLKPALEMISFYKKLCEEKRAGFFLLSSGFWMRTVVNYGGPAIHADYPQTMETDYERRTWVYKKAENKVIERFLFLSAVPSFHQQNKNSGFKITPVDGYGLFLVTENKLTTFQFIQNVRITENLD
jgi:hypothetical protein